MYGILIILHFHIYQIHTLITHLYVLKTLIIWEFKKEEKQLQTLFIQIYI